MQEDIAHLIKEGRNYILKTDADGEMSTATAHVLRRLLNGLKTKASLPAQVEKWHRFMFENMCRYMVPPVLDMIDAKETNSQRNTERKVNLISKKLNGLCRRYDMKPWRTRKFPCDIEETASEATDSEQTGELVMTKDKRELDANPESEKPLALLGFNVETSLPVRNKTIG